MPRSDETENNSILAVLAKPVTIHLPHRLYQYLETEAGNQGESLEHVIYQMVQDAMRHRFSHELCKPELATEFLDFLNYPVG